MEYFKKGVLRFYKKIKTRLVILLFHKHEQSHSISKIKSFKGNIITHLKTK